MPSTMPGTAIGSIAWKRIDRPQHSPAPRVFSSQ